jgi:hypothetical protein
MAMELRVAFGHSLRDYWPVSSDNFKFRVDGFASSSQTACGIKFRDLFVFQASNSTQIHLGIGMGLLCNVPAQTTHKGFYEFCFEIYIKYQKIKNYMDFTMCWVCMEY